MVSDRWRPSCLWPSCWPTRSLNSTGTVPVLQTRPYHIGRLQPAALLTITYLHKDTIALSSSSSCFPSWSWQLQNPKKIVNKFLVVSPFTTSATGISLRWWSSRSLACNLTGKPFLMLTYHKLTCLTYSDCSSSLPQSTICSSSTLFSSFLMSFSFSLSLTSMHLVLFLCQVPCALASASKVSVSSLPSEAGHFWQ